MFSIFTCVGSIGILMLHIDPFGDGGRRLLLAGLICLPIPAWGVAPAKMRYRIFGREIACSDVEIRGYDKSLRRGRTAEPCMLLMNGKAVRIPVGTWLDGSDFETMTFPVDTPVPVGPNVILFGKNEPLRVVFDRVTGVVRTESAVLAKDAMLKVGPLTIPFHAKRYEKELAEVRGQARITFHENGTIEQGYVGPKRFKLKVGPNTLTFCGDQLMKFAKDGSIDEGYLAEASVLIIGKRHVLVRAGTIACYLNGNIFSAELEKPVTLDVGSRTLTLDRRTARFYEDGSLRSGYLREDVPIEFEGGKKILARKQEIFFKSNGDIRFEGRDYTFRTENEMANPTSPSIEEEEEPTVSEIQAKALQGNIEAQMEMGSRCGTGFGVCTDLAEAFKWHMMAAKQGHATAQSNVGAAYLNGDGVKKDGALGWKWLKKAAEQGFTMAQANLGACQALGVGGKRNDIDAYVWLTLSKSVAEVMNPGLLKTVEGRLSLSNLHEAKKRLAKIRERLAALTPSFPAQGVKPKEPSIDVTTTETLPHFTNSVGMRMASLPEGSFTMGASDGESSEKPAHTVRIGKGLHVGTTEVTQGQWKAIMGTTPWAGKGWVKTGDDFPAAYVSWDDARVFCERLSKQEGQVYRLPSEAEWEYAARAGSTGKWCFGDEEDRLEEFAWLGANPFTGGEYGHQVASKKPNAWGLFDMHGNVSEWCEDTWHWTLEGAPTDGSAWISDNSDGTRVHRGGGFGDFPINSRSSARWSIESDTARASTGFRVVLVKDM